MTHVTVQRYLSKVVRVMKSKTVIIAVTLILLYTLAGFFLAPYLVKHQLTKFVQDDLHRQLTIDQVRFNPYTLRMEVEGLSLMEGNGDSLLRFHRLVVDFEVSSLWEWAWTLAEIGLEEPKLTLVIDAQRKTNLKRLMDDLPTEAESPPAPAKAEEPPPRLLFHRIHIGGGSLTTLNRGRRRQPCPSSICRQTSSAPFRSARVPTGSLPDCPVAVAWNGGVMDRCSPCIPTAESL